MLLDIKGKVAAVRFVATELDYRPLFNAFVAGLLLMFDDTYMVAYYFLLIVVLTDCRLMPTAAAALGFILPASLFTIFSNSFDDSCSS